LPPFRWQRSVGSPEEAGNFFPGTAARSNIAPAEKGRVPGWGEAREPVDLLRGYFVVAGTSFLEKSLLCILEINSRFNKRNFGAICQKSATSG